LKDLLRKVMKQEIRKIKFGGLIPVFIAILLFSCNRNDVYFKYQAINATGWNKDSVSTFDILITDTLATYNVYVNMRNKADYQYQNLWLFLSKMSPDSVLVNDSIEFYLADKRGKWLGKGVGSIFEMPVLYQQNVKFKNVGNYQYKIVHGMRDTILLGINDVGMRVEKVAP